MRVVRECICDILKDGSLDQQIKTEASKIAQSVEFASSIFLGQCIYPTEGLCQCLKTHSWRAL